MLLPVRLETPAPIQIDVIAGIENVKDITLQEIASDISYVKLEDHPCLRQLLNVSMIDDYFLINTIDGVYLFGLDGKFVRQFINNQTDFQEQPLSDGSGRIFRGFSYLDGIANSWYSSNKMQLKSFSYYTDGSNSSRRAGYKIDNIAEISVKDNKEIPQISSIYEKSVPLSWSIASERFSFESSDIPVGFGDDFIATFYYLTPVGIELITFNNEGDTLCRFPIFSSMKNLGFTPHNPPAEMHYYYHDRYTFRHLYNDTVFRILSPNIIQSAYILNFGKYSLTFDAAFHRPNELKDYMMCSVLCEDDQYLYLRFNHGFDSPKNREEDIVKFWWGLYQKSTGNFSVLPVNSSKPNDKGINNDIDGGMPFWPESVDNQGRRIALKSGKLIRNMLTDKWFENSKASSPEKKELLEQFVKTLTDTDNVIIIVK